MLFRSGYPGQRGAKCDPSGNRCQGDPRIAYLRDFCVSVRGATWTKTPKSPPRARACLVAGVDDLLATIGVDDEWGYVAIRWKYGFVIVNRVRVIVLVVARSAVSVLT